MLRLVTMAMLALASPAGAGPVETARGAQILADARAACGGSAWDRVTGWHERGQISAAGQPDGTYEGWSAITRPAMALRTDGFAAGYDAGTSWHTGPGGVVASTTTAAVRIALRDAYLSNFGYLQPERFPAVAEDLGPRTIGATAYDIVRIVPAGAEPAELWFDRATHRAARILAGRQASELRDYKTFAGVCSATTAVQTDAGSPQTTTIRVDSVETAPIPKATFAAPAR